VTAVRRRVSWDRHDRRGRQIDLAWAHRLLLLRGYNTLSVRGRSRLDEVLAADDPTLEIGAAWGAKEQLRLVLACTTLAQARAARRRFDLYVDWAAMPETSRLKKTLDAWWPAIETFIGTRATNAKTEAANVTIKTSSAPAAATAHRPTTGAASWPTTPPEARPEHPASRGKSKSHYDRAWRSRLRASVRPGHGRLCAPDAGRGPTPDQCQVFCGSGSMRRARSAMSSSWVPSTSERRSASQT
jgi:hypothetical protein